MRLLYWSLVGLTLAIYGTMLFFTLPHLSLLSGGDPMFDLRPFGYDLVESRALLVALGDEGRGYYLNVQQKLDTAFPALMAVVLVVAYTRLFGPRLAMLASVFAVCGAGFDYLENAAVAQLLRAGQAGVSEAMVAGASRWTILKSMTDSIALTLLVAGVIIWVLKRRNLRR